MTTLPTRTQQDIVSNIAAGMQGRVPSFLNFAIGSVLRAVAEAYGGICLWLQGFALAIAKLTRLSTSFGPDVDSFLADFPLITRFGAQVTTGQVTFSRYTPSSASPVVPVGTIVQTGDGSQRFAVYADTSNPTYSAAANGYVMPAQVTSIQVPVSAVTAGAAGNVSAGAITLMGSSVPGVDLVTNPAPFTSGIDSESDADVKARFQLAVLGRSGGTEYAIRSAIANLRVGMQCSIIDGYDYSGVADPGMVTVIVDDGSGDLSDTLLTMARVAVNAIRAAGVRVGVFPAKVLYVDVVMQIETVQGYDKNVAVAQAVAAVALYINGLGQGGGVGYFDLPGVAKGVTGVTRVSAYTLNYGTTDIPGSVYVTPKARNIEIS